MNLTELLQNDLPLFTPDQTIGELHDFFEEYELTHIGICDAAGLFLGLLSAADIRGRNREMAVSEAEELLRFEAVLLDQHISALLRFLSQSQSNVIPVVSEENQLLGYVRLTVLLDKMKAMPVFDYENDTLLLSRANEDFSLSEVVQIAVSSQAKISGAFIVEQNEKATVVALQLQTQKKQALLDEMRRYGYEIVETSIKDMYWEDLKLNSEYLNRYLNV